MMRVKTRHNRKKKVKEGSGPFKTKKKTAGFKAVAG
jgi:hypothetical protein